jgi:LmbE family N-acetylglucosaminyl deacetylase
LALIRMRAQAFLDAARDFPPATLHDLLGEGGAVVVAPHPDDESLGCGALIATARVWGRPVKIIVLSDGTGSHPRSTRYPPHRLRSLRELEVQKAASSLGVSARDLHCLALPDRFVPNCGPEAERLALLIAEHMRKAKARALFATWRHDPHSDHQAAYDIARKAVDHLPRARLFEYSIWGRALPLEATVPETPRGWRFDGAAADRRKQAAIACHRSQISDLINDDPQGFRLTPDMLARFSGGEEIFFEIEP